MKKRRVPTLVLIILIGAILGFLVFSALTAGKIEVVVPTKKIDKRTKLTDDMFTVKLIGKDVIEKEKIFLATERSQLAGQITSMDLMEGLPIVKSALAVEADKSALMALATDYKGNNEQKVLITITADNVTGVSPDLSNLEKVNVYGSYEKGDFSGTKLFLDSVQVASVQKDPNDETRLLAVTLAVNDYDAETIAYLEQYGKIHLAVVPYGYKVTELEEGKTNGIIDTMFYMEHFGEVQKKSEEMQLEAGLNGESQKQETKTK